MAFNKIPFVWDYHRFKNYFINKTDGVNDPKERSVEMAVDVSMNYFFEDDLEENGMSRLVVFINAFLYAVEHGIVKPDFTHEVEQYIKEFETGEYDELFKPKDLPLVYKDIETIKPHLNR